MVIFFKFVLWCKHTHIGQYLVFPHNDPRVQDGVTRGAWLEFSGFIWRNSGEPCSLLVLIFHPWINMNLSLQIIAKCARRKLCQIDVLSVYVLSDPKLGFLFEELRKHEAEFKEKNERTSAFYELSQVMCAQWNKILTHVHLNTSNSTKSDFKDTTFTSIYECSN